MTSIGKFYLHAAASDIVGTLPSLTSSLTGSVQPTVIASGMANLKMDGTIGTSQVSVALTTQASTTTQSAMFRRWISDPIAAQTIVSQSMTVSCAGAEDNGQSNFRPTFVAAVWRPSTGVVVGRLSDAAASGTEYNTTQTSRVASAAASTAVDTLDGDVIVVEMFRARLAQGNATARLNTIYFDGTTELSATSDAAYLSFVTDPIIMYSAPVTDPTDYWGAAA